MPTAYQHQLRHPTRHSTRTATGTATRTPTGTSTRTPTGTSTRTPTRHPTGTPTGPAPRYPSEPPRWPRLVRERAVELRDPGDIGPRTAPNARPGKDSAAEPDDELFLLGERCAEAYMQAEALQYRAMTLLAQFHRREGWRDTGFSSTAEWLAWRIGITAGAARERVRTALALQDLPRTSKAMRDGELSFTKVRALTRVASADNEEILLGLARAGSAANLERMVRGWKQMDRRSEVEAEELRHRSRRLGVWVNDEGMVMIRGRLDPEVGAVVMRALEAAEDALYRQEQRGPEGRSEKEAAAGLEATTPEQRRADALGLLAERALAAGFGPGLQTPHPDSEPRITAGQPGLRGLARDGNRAPGSPSSAPISGSRAERYQVLLHTDAGTLTEDGEPELSELEDGTRVSAETSRRLACDAGVVPIARDPDGQILGAGRRRRTASPAVRRALEARDRGCRFPGCGLRFTEAHHVKHWADGGESTLRNMVLLCRRHHRAVHEGRVRVCIDVRGEVVFFSPRGKAILGAPRPKPVSLDGVASLGEADGPPIGPDPSPPTDEGRPEDDAPPGGGPPLGEEESPWERVDPPPPEDPTSRAEAPPAADPTSRAEAPPAEDPTSRGEAPPAEDPTSRAEAPPAADPTSSRRTPFPGAALFKRDRDIPWALEALARETLDSG